jgi:hypothetical protein
LSSPKGICFCPTSPRPQSPSLPAFPNKKTSFPPKLLFLQHLLPACVHLREHPLRSRTRMTNEDE